MRLRRNLRTQATVEKGDLLDQKWLTYFLAGVFIVLTIIFIVLLTPAYRQFVVDTVRSVFYGGAQSAPRPQAAPVKFQNPLHLDNFTF